MTDGVWHDDRCCSPGQWKGLAHPDCPGIGPHIVEAVTPEDAGTLLIDCRCGAELRVPQGGDEGGAIDVAMAQHRIQVSRASDPGHVELTPPDWRTDVTDLEGDLPDDGDGGNPEAAGAGE
jgi:hypothetical protein